MNKIILLCFFLFFQTVMSAENLSSHIPQGLKKSVERKASAVVPQVNYHSTQTKQIINEQAYVQNSDDHSLLTQNWLSSFKAMRSSSFNIIIIYEVSHSINSIENVSSARNFGNVIFFEYQVGERPITRIAIPAKSILSMAENP
ncbi:MAG: hypothetical protein HQL32_17800 [Planctomycetes bacterium]|nr:hypothetical protein [Planctomycetota bacterium]